ncbi:hypothetical protein DVH05_020144 [Phytophthora capsici]|nr:hypothetical protein DVH05_020144 [Phytophthora capsici]
MQVLGAVKRRASSQQALDVIAASRRLPTHCGMAQERLVVKLPLYDGLYRDDAYQLFQPTFLERAIADLPTDVVPVLLLSTQKWSLLTKLQQPILLSVDVASSGCD